MLSALKRAKGRKRASLRRTASKHRARMIRRNRAHPEEGRPKYNRKALERAMPTKYRALIQQVMKTKSGRQALKKYRSFIGLPFPTEIKTLDIGPKNKTVFAVGMGRCPLVQVADGPRGKHKKIKKYRGKFTPVFSPDGRRIAILSGRTKGYGKNVKFVGYAPETHYIMSNDMEAAGSFKRGKYWVHQHHDEGGRWPKVYRDAAGNFFYGPGTYRVGAWIRK